jgi:hypothetical protein
VNGVCRLCGAAAQPFGEALLLQTHQVHYFRCQACGFVQTEDPYWLAEAYREALSELDVGAVSRNLRLATVAGALIRRFFEPDGRFIDYGGGTGLFVRLMRDEGFDFWWLDKHARNIFARGFEADSGRFELLTASEVFEHLVRPVAELEGMLAYSRNVLFTTVLLPPDAPRPGHWWYYGLEHGQHVAFYTRDSLRSLANRFGLCLCSCGEIHLLSEKPIKLAQFRLALRPWMARWLGRLRPRLSLADADYRRLASRRPEPEKSP